MFSLVVSPRGGCVCGCSMAAFSGLKTSAAVVVVGNNDDVVIVGIGVGISWQILIFAAVHNVVAYSVNDPHQSRPQRLLPTSH